MIDEPSSDPSSEPGHEADRPIALGGPIAPGDEPAPSAPSDLEPEPRLPESEPSRPVPPFHEPTPAPSPAPQKRSAVMPVLGVLGFVILAAAIGYLWVRPVPTPAMPAMPPDESSAVAALQSDVATLKTSLAALDSRENSDVAALHAAIAALPPPAPPSAGAPSAPAAPATASAAPSAASQAAPDAALAETVTSLSDRLKALQDSEAAQAQQAQSLPSAAVVSNLASRVDALAQRQSKDGDALRQDLGLVQQQLATLSGQAQTFTKTSAALPKLTAQADKLSAILHAQEALRAGLPLGTIEIAPPALTRFADTAPPTEAALRLSFATAAEAADKAGEPTPDQGPFWHRIWLRVQDLVMVRQGDRVVLGDPTSAVLTHAQTELDAGDLSGTLAVLGTLTGSAAQAMAPWEAQARALLDAREALTQMAAG
jgi:hypothetical protein